MATLNIRTEFSAFHGTCDTVESDFRIVLCIQGPLFRDFIRAVDFYEAKRLVDNVAQGLEGKYLDDIVGRATLENIACYVLFRTRLLGPWSASVEAGQDVAATVMVDDFDLGGYAAMLHYKRGASLLVRKHFSDAIRELDKALAIDPSLVEAIICRGRCHRRLGDLEAALREFCSAIAVAPECGEAWRNLASALFEMTRYDEMMAAFDRAVELMPQSALARNNRGFALQKLGRLEDAIGDHTVAIKLDPTYAEAFGDRAEAYYALGFTEASEKDRTTMRHLQRLEDPDAREWLKTWRTSEIGCGLRSDLRSD